MRRFLFGIACPVRIFIPPLDGIALSTGGPAAPSKGVNSKIDQLGGRLETEWRSRLEATLRLRELMRTPKSFRGIGVNIVLGGLWRYLPGLAVAPSARAGRALRHQPRNAQDKHASSQAAFDAHGISEASVLWFVETARVSSFQPKRQLNEVALRYLRGPD